jgi:hypothetical protein
VSYKGLLIDPPYAFEIAHVERILRPAIARVFALELSLSASFSVLAFVLSHHLRFSQNQTFLRDLGL